MLEERLDHAERGYDLQLLLVARPVQLRHSVQHILFLLCDYTARNLAGREDTVVEEGLVLHHLGLEPSQVLYVETLCGRLRACLSCLHVAGDNNFT